MIDFEKLLSGGDLRSTGESNSIVKLVKNQADFDLLYRNLDHPDRLVVMRTADAIEKITKKYPEYLQGHELFMLSLCNREMNIELRWHLALLLPRLHLNADEFSFVWHLLAKWALNKANSRIVRVNSIQGLYEMSAHNGRFANKIKPVLDKIEPEKIPSLNARIRKLRNLIADA